jgi:hypothetical protein
MPDVTTNIGTLSKGVTDLARDAAYVAIGLGVLGYQRVQVQRVELQNRLSQAKLPTKLPSAKLPTTLPRDFSIEQRIDEVRQGVAKGYNQIDDLAEQAVQFVETTLQPFEERLPGSVTQLTIRARQQARDVRIQIRQRVNA